MADKTYRLTKDHFKVFVQECKRRLAQAGVRNMPVTFVFDSPPPYMGPRVLACTLTYKNSQKLAIYLNPTWHRYPKAKTLRYLAAHEIVENVLQESFLTFTEKCVKAKRIDEEDWKTTVHATMNRIISMIDPDLMVEETDKSWEN